MEFNTIHKNVSLIQYWNKLGGKDIGLPFYYIWRNSHNYSYDSPWHGRILKIDVVNELDYGKFLFRASEIQQDLGGIYGFKGIANNYEFEILEPVGMKRNNKPEWF